MDRMNERGRDRNGTRVLHLDCFSGASGDMVLGALLDLGVPGPWLENRLRSTGFDGWTMEVRTELRGSIAGTRVIFHCVENESRFPREIIARLEASSLQSDVKTRAVKILQCLVSVESRIHAMDSSQLHLHELGSLDTVLDVVGVVAALDYLGVDEVTASPMPLGGGLVPCRHGLLPVPSPAAVAILEGVPVYDDGRRRELVTPTGAAIIKMLSHRFGGVPQMILEKVGYGVGAHGEDDPPNLLRAFLGQRRQEEMRRRLCLVETHIDDMNPEFYDHLLEKLLSQGALDVAFADLHMKKNRSGQLVRVLVEESQLQRVREILFRETTTLGVMVHRVERWALPREVRQVATRYGKIHVKIARLPDGTEKVKPEYEDCKRVSRETGTALPVVYDEAKHATQNVLRR